MSCLISFVLVVLDACITNGCGRGSPPVPRPRTYIRLDTPVAKYVRVHLPCGLTCNINANSRVVEVKEGWFNLEYPDLNGVLHCTCTPFVDRAELAEKVRESRELAYRHSIRASDISELPLQGGISSIRGVLYMMQGNSASPLQFFLTDTSTFFLRCALYFNAYPNYDSLLPLILYVRRDIDTMISTIQREPLLGKK